MSVHDGPNGTDIDIRDGYGNRIRKTFASRTVAEAVHATIKREAEAMRRSLTQFSKAGDIKIGEAINEYIEGRVSAPRTRRTEQERLSAFVHYVGNRPLIEISPGLVADFISYRQGFIAPWTLYRESRMLSAVFAWCQEKLGLPTNPVSVLRPKAPQVTRARALSFEESAELMRVVSTRTRGRVLCAHDAGGMSLEIHQLRVRHVSKEELLLDIWPAKGHARRLVPMTQRLAAHLLEIIVGCKNPDALLFHHRGHMISDQGRHELTKQINLPTSFQFRFHDLRHTFGTRIAAVAQRPRLQQYLLGHHPRTPSEKYDHRTVEECRAAIEAMDAARKKAENKP